MRRPVRGPVHHPADLLVGCGLHAGDVCIRPDHLGAIILVQVLDVQLCAFDCLALDGDDLRKLPLSMRKANLARLLARRPHGIFPADCEQGEIGPALFRKACEFGLAGIVSKRDDRPYRAGKSQDWVKIKNRAHPAMSRVSEAFR
jgi:hypothetical protein